MRMMYHVIFRVIKGHPVRLAKVLDSMARALRFGVLTRRCMVRRGCTLGSSLGFKSF